MSAELIEPTERLDAPAGLSSWRDRVEALAAEVERWSSEQGWGVDRGAVTLREEGVAPYTLPTLRIHVPGQDLCLEPIARFVMGAAGRVDLYSYPSMDRVMLLHDGDRWIIRPELGPRWPLSWSRETYVDLAERLATEA